MKVPKNCPYCQKILTPDSIEGTVYSCIEACYQDCGQSPIAYCLTDIGPVWDDVGAIWIVTDEYRIRWDFDNKTTGITKKNDSIFNTLMVFPLTEIEYDRDKLQAWAKEMLKLLPFS